MPEARRVPWHAHRKARNWRTWNAAPLPSAVVEPVAGLGRARAPRVGVDREALLRRIARDLERLQLVLADGRQRRQFRLQSGLV